MPDVDADEIMGIREGALSPGERASLVEQYLEGDCLTFAFAVHWMTGWPVEAVSERGGTRHLHFAAVSPSGLAWDAAGPRSKADAGAAYAGRARWERVDAVRFVSTQQGVDEDAITRACHDAVRLLGPALDPYVTRLPVPSCAPAP